MNSPGEICLFCDIWQLFRIPALWLTTDRRNNSVYGRGRVLLNVGQQESETQ